jgi:hypothetical protein
MITEKFAKLDNIQGISSILEHCYNYCLRKIIYSHYWHVLENLFVFNLHLWSVGLLVLE